VIVGVVAGRVEGANRTTFLLPFDLQRFAVGHGEEPRPKLVGLDIRPILDGLDERLLQGVLGLMVVAENAEQEMEQRRFVTFKQHFERAIVAGAGSFDEFAVAQSRHDVTSKGGSRSSE